MNISGNLCPGRAINWPVALPVKGLYLETGLSCCEHLHMSCLSCAQCPPGMKQQVLVFYTKLLGRIRQPLLPHINVHRPVQKLIRLCGEVLATPTENEEIQFLCIVCAKLKQDPYLVNFFLEVCGAPMICSSL